tara:strand:- start:6611 stop:6793 length:183 start_codon:yes stop_codon:yes gene_type:complete
MALKDVETNDLITRYTECMLLYEDCLVIAEQTFEKIKSTRNELELIQSELITRDVEINDE